MIQNSQPSNADLSPSAKRKVLRVVRELEALSQSTNSPAEAASAAAKAQNLLLKNQLSISDVEEFESDEDPLIERKEVLDGKKHIAGWKQILLAVVSEACMCEWITSFASEAGDRTFSSIARSSNVEVARYTFRVLERQVIELGEQEKQRRRMAGESTRKYMKDYLEGIIDTIHNLLTKERAAAVKENEQANALIVRSGLEAEDHRKKLYPEVVFTKRTTYYDSNSRERGQIAGQKVKLNDAIGSDGKRQKLIE